jgi:DNA repair protein RadA/Sms
VLVDEAQGASPRRLAVGMDGNRLGLLLAVLHRHGGYRLGDQDVFANVVGGLRIQETGIDLGVALAVVSSLRSRPIPPRLVVFGEVGLTGELRPVANGQERLREAAKQGFTHALIAHGNRPPKPVAGISVMAVKDLGSALDAAFEAHD